MKRVIVPQNDVVELACRFNGICNLPDTLPAPAQPLTEGAQEKFWVNNEDTQAYFQSEATLRYVTPHVYFWVENKASYDFDAIKNLVDAFENEIYPTNREFFGSEWTPGVDNDPHIYILYTTGLGSNVAGYFYSPDEYNPQVRQYSNAHEMFYINASESLSNDYTYGTLAHEFQHMIHWYQDRNESAFLNEGLSELATFLNRYDTGGFDMAYLSNPDSINVTDWTGDTGGNTEHYGASFILLTYFLDRFGEETTKALIHDQQNGLTSMDDVLARQNVVDGLTGKVITADDFFLDWAVTNYVLDPSVGDGRYDYHNYPSAPRARLGDTVSTCPVDLATRTVNQYGVDYIRINCAGSHTLRFEGATSTRLVPADPFSGTHAFWSNKGDEFDMTLTRQFDLGAVSGPVSLDYWVWYDIEEDFDYAYLEASTDGQQWQVLQPPSSTDSNAHGASYGWGYTGLSGGWREESVDLSQYAGSTVYIRFEYLTDPGVNGEGMLIDNVSIDAINYSTDFEQEDSSWIAEGFARIENTVPQTFSLALISQTSNGPTVQIIPLTADQSADIPFTIGNSGADEVVLVVIGTTRFTRELAPYQFSIR